MNYSIEERILEEFQYLTDENKEIILAFLEELLSAPGEAFSDLH